MNIDIITKAVLAHTALHDIIVQKLFIAISAECAILCRHSKPTCFRTKPVKELQDFQWLKYIGEMETKSPLLLKLMRKIMQQEVMKRMYVR